MLKRSVHIVFFALMLIAINSCIEEINPEQVIADESILVVDARISDRAIEQHVFLSRSFQFDSIPKPEIGAEVRLESSTSSSIPFIESKAGTYSSGTPLNLGENETYQLKIVLQDGTSYVSKKENMPKRIPIDEVVAKREIEGDGTEGVSIYVSNNTANGDPTFFRYEYEETYKIIAPRWDPFKLVVVRNEPCYPDPFVVDIEPWEDERKVCFGNRVSNEIIQASTFDLNENQSLKRVQFVDRDNYIISHRYSILVHQYSQTADAFSFYERLNDFASTGLIFSQVQPGLLEGNISPENNSGAQILGYFELSSYSSRRMYFNYEDLFPSKELPPYAINCETLGNPRLFPEAYHCAAPGVCDGNCDSPLIGQILAGLVTFASENEDDFISPYNTWPSPCGDCTKLGSNVVPEFWEE